jgi:hypothetical protein
MLDGVMLLWVLLTAAALVFVAIDIRCGCYPGNTGSHTGRRGRLLNCSAAVRSVDIYVSSLINEASRRAAASSILLT